MLHAASFRHLWVALNPILGARTSLQLSEGSAASALPQFKWHPSRAYTWSHCWLDTCCRECLQARCSMCAHDKDDVHDAVEDACDNDPDVDVLVPPPPIPHARDVHDDVDKLCATT